MQSLQRRNWVRHVGSPTCMSFLFVMFNIELQGIHLHFSKFYLFFVQYYDTMMWIHLKVAKCVIVWLTLTKSIISWNCSQRIKSKDGGWRCVHKCKPQPNDCFVRIPAFANFLFQYVEIMHLMRGSMQKKTEKEKNNGFVKISRQ